MAVFVVVGGSRGLGLALTNELASRGHKVCVGARDISHIRTCKNVLTHRMDAAVYDDMVGLSTTAQTQFGPINAWLNCQGISGGYGEFHDMDTDVMATVAMTNFLGTVNGSRRALQVFRDNGVHGHLFNVTGAGYDAGATPGHAVYGATKAGITQLTKTLRSENPGHGVHLLNPGMMTTELLYEGLPPNLRSRVELVAEDPNVVAATLVTKILMAMDRGSRGMSMKYMTVRRVLRKLASNRK